MLDLFAFDFMNFCFIWIRFFDYSWKSLPFCVKLIFVIKMNQRFLQVWTWFVHLLWWFDPAWSRSCSGAMEKGLHGVCHSEETAAWTQGIGQSTQNTHRCIHHSHAISEGARTGTQSNPDTTCQVESYAEYSFLNIILKIAFEIAFASSAEEIWQGWNVRG